MLGSIVVLGPISSHRPPAPVRKVVKSGQASVMLEASAKWKLEMSNEAEMSSGAYSERARPKFRSHMYVPVR